MPVPLETLAEAGDALAAPVLAPETGNLDAGLQALLQNLEAPLAALGTDDESVVDPVRKLRLPSQICGQLFEKRQEVLGPLKADQLRHIPGLQLVIARLPEIEVAVGCGIHVQIVAPGGNIGRLREIGVVVITAGTAVFHIAPPGNISRLVPANARLTGPDGEVSSLQVEVAHLLAETVDMLRGI